MEKKLNRQTIGRKEMASFPELEIPEIEVKIDTGAYSSSIHCTKIEVKGQEELAVVFLEENEPGFTGKEMIFTDFDYRDVKSSNGSVETRIAIITKFRMNGRRYRIRLTLTDRSAMRTPVLIGRRFLKRYKFMVDPSLDNGLGSATEQMLPAPE